jgi:NADPH:quinone reductase-like Zn-dependent oxidoreductase
LLLRLLFTGDPVEVNAAISTLVTKQFRLQPLSLLASKSQHGHGEPAAGLIALSHTAEAASHYLRLPMLHLRTPNPLIIGVMDQMPEQAAGRGAMVARQAAPQVAAGAQQQLLSSTSSFAFMGTNANVIMQTSFSMDSSAATMVGNPRQLVWSRCRSWVLPPTSLFAASAVAGGAASGQVVMQADLSAVQLSYLWDHQVAGSVVFPGAGYLTAAAAASNALLAAAGPGKLALQSATIPAPLVLPSIWSDRLQVPVLQVCVDTSSSSVSISSVNSSINGSTTHFSSKFTMVAAAAGAGSSVSSTTVTVARVPAWLQALSASAATAAAADGGYIPGATAAVATAQHNDGCGELDVGVFDSWLQAGQVFILEDMAQGGVYVPASVDLVLLPGSAAGASSTSSSMKLAYVQPHASPAGSSKQAVSDYQLLGADGAVCSIQRMTAKPIASSKPAGATAAAAAAQQPAAQPELLYEVQWQAVGAAGAAAGGEGVDQMQGASAVSSSTAAAALAAIQGLLKHQTQATLTGTGEVPWDSTAGSGAGAAGASWVDSTSAGAATAAMLRCIGQEQPGLQLSLLQHSSYDYRSSAVGAGAAVLSSSSVPPADVFGSISDAGYVAQPRLLPALAAAQIPRNFQLMPLTRGSLDSLTPVPVSAWPDFSTSGSSVGSGRRQVLVKVAAVGINFRDVLNVLGMYPGDPGAPGSDFSGVVVSGPLSGSAVFGLSTAALASHVVASEQTVAPMPATVSFEAAATVPTVFTTADAALRQIAGLAAGERVLVHGAAGGVGLAAIQAAAAAGAVVFGTAGSSAKRHLLRTLGCKVAVASRDTTFAGDIALAGGVDVVLNSLTSPGMVGGSLAVLKQGGRFVEIGKRDIWAPAAVAAERPDVAFHMLAIDFMPPAVLQQLLLQVSRDLATGRVAPIRAAVHDMTVVHAAMRQMAQARHVGKVVVSHHSAHLMPSSTSSSSSPSMAVSASSSCGGHVLVTGGTGALGQLVGSWLSTQQVQYITLCSRTGKLSSNSGSSSLPLTDPHHPLFSSMVSITACDVSAASDVNGLFRGALGSASPALSALMHAGGVLADAALQNQSVASMRTVAAPKSVALQLLVQQLVSLPVVSSVLFSSMAALLGSAGQSNYAASNASLDAAARQLQRAGLSATSVQFSAWAGAGMAAATASKVEAMGIGALSPAAGLSALEAAVRSGLSMTR